MLAIFRQIIIVADDEAMHDTLLLLIPYLVAVDDGESFVRAYACTRGGISCGAAEEKFVMVSPALAAMIYFLP